jgi:alpha-mannosidase
MYIHMRPQPGELELPSDLYRWRGVDGSEILGLRISVGLYHTERDNILERLREGTDLALKLNRDVPVFWGIGDHGGGPTREDLKKISAFRNGEDRVRVLHSTPEKLYAALAASASGAPLVEGDLQRCFTGTYTSISRLKRRCQESLAQLLQSETLRTVTWWAGGQPYPAEEMAEAWRDHLFNDFHDILPGSCTEPAERDAMDQYGRVAETVRRMRLGAAVSFNRGTPGKLYIPLTVLNANPQLTALPVEVDCMVDLRPKWTGHWHLRLFDRGGNEHSCQEEQPESLLPFNGWRRRVSFMAETGGIGAKNYELRIVEGTAASEPKPAALPHSISAETGLVDHLDAGGGRECLSGHLLRPLVVEDEGDSWGSGLLSYRVVKSRFEKTSGPHIVEKGPIRSITESVYTSGGSRVVIDTIAYSGWPVLEFRFRITWNDIRRRLKLSIPTVFRSPAFLCDVPGGAILRPADGGEHVHGRWCMLGGNLNGRETAFAVVNSGQHGLDFQEGELRLSVLRSAAYCHEQGLPLGEWPERKYMDVGVHEFRIAVTAGDPGAVRSLIPGIADRLCAPPLVYAHLPVGIPAPPHQNEEIQNPFLTLSPGTVSMLCCKRSWDGESLVLRLHETAGVAAKTQLHVAMPALSLDIEFRPFEIKTLRIERSGQWQEVSLIDEN